MKMALSIRELIDALNKMENKDTEVWIKDGDGFVHPCSRADYDAERNCIILDEDMPTAKEFFDKLRKKEKAFLQGRDNKEDV